MDSAGQAPLEQLRLALVLNGGVSLAVWMGGVAQELQLLSDATPDGASPYTALLSLARTGISIDVIAGTSAGGINGAALAMGQVNESAKLGTLRTLWADKGRMQELLRRPFRGQPTSLLRGDEYFLPALEQAMSTLAEDFTRSDRDIDLTITTTLLNGSQTVTPDSIGQSIPQTIHGGSYHFRSGDPTDYDTHRHQDDDPFTENHMGFTVRALALAARSSAGFPFAFEPTFIPAQDNPHALSADGSSSDLSWQPPSTPGERVDMGRFVDWRFTGGLHRVLADRSRYAVDGGVLANTPTKAALEAINRRPADGPLRRLLLLVHPHAPAYTVDSADTEAEPFTLVAGMSKLLGAATSDGDLNFVEQIDKHNLVAATWRGGRSDVMETLWPADGSGDGVAGLYDLVRVAYPHYRRLRTRRAAADLAHRAPPADGWSFERVRAAAASAQGDGASYVPVRPPPDDSSLGAPSSWGWGPVVAEGVADSASEALRIALSVAAEQHQAALKEARRSVSDARLLIGRIRSEMDASWYGDPVLGALTPDNDYWHARRLTYDHAMGISDLPGDVLADALKAPLEAARKDFEENSANWPDATAASFDPGTQAARFTGATDRPGARIRTAVDSMIDALLEVRAAMLAVSGTDAATLVRLRPWVSFLYGDPPPTAADGPDAAERRLLLRLLALDVATWLVADDRSSGSSRPIDLVQLTLRIDNWFARQSITPDDKVAGMSLHRFGGFLKRSWRINDWTWGRLDAATMLARVVLSPQRLRRIALLGGLPLTPTEDEAGAKAEEMVAALQHDLFGTVPPPDLPDRPFAALRTDAVDELTAALRQPIDEAANSTYLRALADIAAYALHLRIIVEELPVLAAAIRADAHDGASARSNGAMFLVQEKNLLDALDGPPQSTHWHEYGPAALVAFDRAGVGRESLADEAGSDEVVRTTATAAAVFATVIDSDRSGVPAIKPVTRAVRGVALVAYWLLNGITGGSRTARALTLAALTLGGVLLALSTLGVLAKPIAAPAAAIGGGTALAAFAYSALRTGSMLHGLVLLSPIGPLIAFAIQRAHEPATEPVVSGSSSESSGAAVSAVVVVLAVVAGLLLLASLPWPLRSPVAALRHRGGEKLAVTAGVVVALAAVIAGVLVAAHFWSDVENWWDDQRAHLVAAAIVLSVALTIVGGMAAKIRGEQLRTWTGRPGEVRPFAVRQPVGVAAGWAAVYGTGYLVVAWGVALLVWGQDLGDQAWLVATVVWSAVLAVVLLAFVPVAITRRFRTALTTELRADPRMRLVAKGSADEFRRELLRRGVLFAYLVDTTGVGPTRQGTKLMDAVGAEP